MPHHQKSVHIYEYLRRYRPFEKITTVLSYKATEGLSDKWKKTTTVAANTAWRSDAAESPYYEEPEVIYVNVTRHKWIMKYNAL